MKSNFPLFFLLIGSITWAECTKSMWGSSYYVDFEDGQKNEFTLYSSTKQECEHKENLIRTAKTPFLLCGCEPAERKKRYVYAPAMLGASLKYMLYCFSFDEKGIVHRRHVRTWSEEIPPNSLASSSAANLKACEEYQGKNQ